MAVVVETSDLLQTVAAALVGSVGITAVFSISIWGAARSVELSRDERPFAAIGAAAIGILALLATLAAVAIGIAVMTEK